MRCLVVLIPSQAVIFNKDGHLTLAALMSNLADRTFLDATYRRGLAPEPQIISLGLGRSGGIAANVQPAVFLHPEPETLLF